MKFEIVFKGLQQGKKVLTVLSSVKDKASQITGRMTKMRDSIEDALHISPINNFIRGLFSYKSAATNTFKKTKEAIQLGLAPLKNGLGALRSLRETGVGGFKALQIVMSSFGKTASVVLKSLLTSVASLGVAVATILGPIVLVGVAIFALKKIWDANIGGIASKWSKFVGEAKQAWFSFNNTIIKTLRKLAPFFSAVFGGLFEGVSIVFKTLTSGAKEIFGVFSSVFGGMDDEMSGIISLGKILGGIFKLLGKGLSLAMKPALVILKGVAAVIAIILKGIIAIVDGAKKVGKFLGFKGDEAKEIKNNPTRSSTPISTNSTNNNQTITVITSRPIDGNGAKGFGDVLATQLAQRG